MKNGPPNNPERRFQCPNCVRSFRRIEHLRRHEALHSGTRSYKCPDCNASFFRADILVRHLRNVHSESLTGVKQLRESLLARKLEQKKLRENEKNNENAIMASIQKPQPKPNNNNRITLPGYYMEWPDDTQTSGFNALYESQSEGWGTQASSSSSSKTVDPPQQLQKQHQQHQRSTPNNYSMNFFPTHQVPNSDIFPYMLYPNQYPNFSQQSRQAVNNGMSYRWDQNEDVESEDENDITSTDGKLNSETDPHFEQED